MGHGLRCREWGCGVRPFVAKGHRTGVGGRGACRRPFNSLTGHKGREVVAMSHVKVDSSFVLKIARYAGFHIFRPTFRG